MAPRLQVVGYLVKQHPHIVVAPVVLLAALLGLGVWGALDGVRMLDEQSRARAQVSLDSSTKSMDLDMKRATLPLDLMGALVPKTPNVDAFLQTWEAYAPVWWNAVPAGTLSLTVAPQMVVSAIYPPDVSKAFTPEVGYLGQDMFGAGPVRNSLLQLITSRQMLLGGPLTLPGRNMSFMVIFWTVVLPNATENETWGAPRQPTDCPVGVCWNATTKTKLWGLVSLKINADVFFNSAQYLTSAADALKVQLWESPDPSLGEVDPKLLFGVNQTTPADALCNVLQVLNRQWTICMWHDNWVPLYLEPVLLSVVVGGSVVMCGLLFNMLLAWSENRDLLHSMLPEETIKRMKHEGEWTKGSTEGLRAILLETPARHMLAIVEACIQGVEAPMSKLLAVRDALHRGKDPYRPMDDDLHDCMDYASNLDAEVRQALAAQLMGESSTQLKWDLSSATTNYDKRLILAGSYDPDAVSPTDPTAELSHQLVLAVIANSSVLPAVIEDRLSGMGPGNSAAAYLDQLDSQSVPASLFTKLEKVLFTSGEWSFDAFELANAAQGRPLSALAYWLLHSTGLMQWAKMDAAKLVRFLCRVEDGYPNNPYHSRLHAADVLQSMHVIIHRGGLLANGYVDHFTMLGAYLAAITHDLEHLGRSNDFLVHANDALAIRYNDRSPMENHHMAATWELLRQQDLNCLSGLSKNGWNKLRKLVIDLVLATDMKQHFAVLGQFNALEHPYRSSTPDSSPGSPGIVPRAIAESDTLLSLQVALKVSDLGHLAAPLDIHVRWTRALEEEFFLQGDAERELGLTMSPLCDRTKSGGVPKSQVGFIDFVVRPLFLAMCGRFAATKPLHEALEANYQHWVKFATVNIETSGA